MFSQFSWKTYADLGLRILLIVLATVILTAVTESINYDLHLGIRKAQPTDPDIIVLEVDNLYDLKETLEKGRLSSANSIYIYANTIINTPIAKNLKFYSADGATSNSDTLNFLFREDADGQVRRFTNLDKLQSSPQFPMGFRNKWENKPQHDILINFRGPNQTFERSDIFGLGEKAGLRFEKKTIVVFNRLNPKTVVTPLGPMDESEVIANLLDNFKNDRFIHKIGTSYQFAICGVLLILSLFIILYLPAFLALIGMTILFFLYISFSLFLFDQIYLWSPILTPMIQILLTYVLISNYKYMLNENTKWKLERKARYMREVEEMKNNFLGLFSHDLKTPLAKVIGISETLLTDSSLDGKHLEEIKKIRTYSRELEKYLKRIIKTSQLQSEKVSLMKSQGDINIVIQKCIDKMKPLSDEKNINIQFEETPLFLIDFDHQLIEEVLFNFIENAIHYTPQDGTILILASEVGDFVKVGVIDKGPGIDKTVADKVWDKFFRLETKKQGYGLGLYLSKYVIELHQGRVYLNSEPGQGSEFGFLIPISGEQND